MLAKITEFVKKNLDTIILSTLVALFILLSFASGYIIAKYQDRAPITITNEQLIPLKPSTN